MITGYQNIRSGFRTGSTIYSEAIDQATGGKVFIQEIESLVPSLDELASLKNDYEITRSLAIPGALKSLALIKAIQG